MNQSIGLANKNQMGAPPRDQPLYRSRAVSYRALDGRYLLAVLVATIVIFSMIVSDFIETGAQNIAAVHAKPKP